LGCPVQLRINSMNHSLIRRTLLSTIALLGITLLVFILSHIVPGDPARMAAGPQAREEQVESVRKEFGLDKSLPEQYFIYMKNLLHGNLGKSLQSRRPVLDDLIDYFPATLELTLIATVIAVAFGILIGIISAIQKDKSADHLARIFSLTGVSMPVFWLGIILVIIFYRQLGILPFGGRISPKIMAPDHITGLYILDSILTGNWEALKSSTLYIILPSFTLAYSSLAVVSRMTRASLLETIHEDYIRTARGKGLSERMILWGHALRNAMIPVTTIIGLQFGGLLGGAFLVEVIFSWPGLGTYAMKAILFLDYNGIIGVTLLVGFTYMLVNLLVDFVYIIVDPRMRTS
jgi:peptide/nickel transport system permease protein